MAWMTMQITAGLRRLGHDVYYLEVTSDWPYDPIRQTKVREPGYAVEYLARVAERFGLGDRWAYRASYSEGQWFGMSGTRAENLLVEADAVFNIAGATWFGEDRLKTSRLVYYGTDPVLHEIRYANGDPNIRMLIDEHTDCVTYGENIGDPGCPIPPLPRLRARTRQPVLLDEWDGLVPHRDVFTTVSNWEQKGLDLPFQGQTYRWSKHHEFLKFIDAPRRVRETVELAMNLAVRPVFDEKGNEAVPAFGLDPSARRLLESNGWSLVDSAGFTRDPWTYRDYVQASKAEFTVARDLNVRLRSGWFSERSVCYLAASRPVIAQDTGFGDAVPTGEGLFSFNTTEEAVAAFDAIRSDYARHSRAARAIAEEYFRAETVLAKVLCDLGL